MKKNDDNLWASALQRTRISTLVEILLANLTSRTIQQVSRAGEPKDKGNHTQQSDDHRTGNNAAPDEAVNHVFCFEIQGAPEQKPTDWLILSLFPRMDSPSRGKWR